MRSNRRAVRMRDRRRTARGEDEKTKDCFEGGQVVTRMRDKQSRERRDEEERRRV
uniref:Uncharacterized protein n=1 Tax=Cucumis melo TaxID=3656 RepID=A0A9I9EB10_CUCME